MKTVFCTNIVRFQNILAASSAHLTARCCRKLEVASRPAAAQVCRRAGAASSHAISTGPCGAASTAMVSAPTRCRWCLLIERPAVIGADSPRNSAHKAASRPRTDLFSAVPRLPLEVPVPVAAPPHLRPVLPRLAAAAAAAGSTALRQHHREHFRVHAPLQGGDAACAETVQEPIGYQKKLTYIHGDRTD